MKLAVIADCHIPDCPGSAEEAALAWAVNAAEARAMGAVVCAGDVTAAGGPGEVERALEILKRIRLPFVCTPGNSDLRTPRFAERARTAFARPAAAECGPVRILGIDTSDGGIRPRERRRFAPLLERAVAAGGVVLVTHWPPNELPGREDREWLAGLVGRFRPELVIAGHKHRDADLDFAGVPLKLVRGIDPEKAIGAPPALAVFVRGPKGRWRRQETGMEEWDPRAWPEMERRGLLQQLGISTMTRTLEDARGAIRARAPVLELRAGAMRGVRMSVLTAVLREWREAGGRRLSLHLPDLRWNAGEERIEGEAAVTDAVEVALRLDCEQVTMHVPRGRRRDFSGESSPRELVLEAFTKCLAPCATAGMVIGIENLHRTAGDPPGENGPFGCLPAECLDWTRELRRRLTYARIGPLLDIGHARNNPGNSQVWTLGRWLAEVAPRAVGYHVHQVTAAGNHQPFQGAFGPVISLAALFWGWRTGRFARGPMFLEIRPESALRSLEVLRAGLGGGG